MLLLLACASDSTVRAAAVASPDRRAGPTDAVSETAATTLSGGDADDEFGNTVGRAGDVNGDGYDDLVVGAPHLDVSSKVEDVGEITVYLGSAAGIGTSASRTITGTDDGAQLGEAVAGVGDIDDDGFADVAFAAPALDDSATDQGGVYLFRGSAAGIGPTEDQLLLGGAASDWFGTAVAGGDLDADGYSDVVVGAYCAGGGMCGGEAYAFYGGPGGVDATPEVLLTGATDRELLGWSLDSDGDVNGDGYADVIVGAGASAVSCFAEAGAVYLLYGSTSGMALGWSVYGSYEYNYVGLSVNLVGDLDGDGYDDVAIGVIGDNTWSGTSEEGEAWVFYGSGAGPASSADLVIGGEASGDRFGDKVAGAGDVDDDGFDDLLITAPLVDLGTGERNAGAAYLYEGSAEGLVPTPVDVLYGVDDGSSMGSSATGLGDVDGDGFGDIAVGSDGWDEYTYLDLVGKVYVYRGYDDNEVDADGDGVGSRTDCDDADATVGAGVLAYADTDGDGFGDPERTASDCGGTSGVVSNGDDCDDHDATVNPAGTEVCGGGDEDCDGLVDDADSVTPTTSWYADADGDGYGAGTGVLACDAPAGFVATASDCDDADATVNPGADEVCGGGDEDCDGLVDDDDTVSIRPAWYTDADGDGYGTGSAIRACVAPAGTASSSGDCDDANAAANPGAREVCGGGDEDCDGLTDDADPSTDVGSMATLYEDRDGDGFGDPRAAVTACSAFPTDAVRDGTDCDDTDATAHPGGTEVCGGGDEDCDGVVDEDCEDTGVDTAGDTAVDTAVDTSVDTGVDSDSAVETAVETAADSDVAGDTAKSAAAPEGCGCGATAPGSGWTALLLAGGLVRRRRDRDGRIPA